MTRRMVVAAACAASTLTLTACMMPTPDPEPAPPTATTVPGAMYDDETGARLWTARLDTITGPRLVCMEVEGRPAMLACVTDTPAHRGASDE